MQQLSKDLWQCMENEYGNRAALCVLPRMRLWIGKDIHLGDASLVPLGWVLKKFGAKRVTVTACGLDIIWPLMWYQWLLKKTLPFMDHVVCISAATAEEVRRRGVPEKKISVIPCGIWGKMCHAEEPSRDGSRQFCGACHERRRRAKSLTMTRLRTGTPHFGVQARRGVSKDVF